MKQGAIFDMDGVLFDTERLYQKTWRAVASEMGVTLPIEFTYAVSGSAKDAVVEAVRRFYGTDEPEKVIAEVYERMRVRQQSPLPIKPGVTEILSFFREQGLKIAVASSTYHDLVEENLKRHDLIQYFDAVIGGDEVTKAKPEPDIFLFAAERIGLPPEECWIFEDSFNGIRAGHAAGAAPILVVDLMEPDEEIRSLSSDVFPDMFAALAALKNR